MGDAPRSLRVIIGILALQGAFAEHQNFLQKLPSKVPISTVLVRTTEDLTRCDALIIPGGESTTIALLARLSGLFDALKVFVREKPVWGTCAGAILLSQSVEGAKKGGQELLGGISITIARNGYGSQVESFEADLLVDGLRDPRKPYKGVFIRAPIVLKFTSSPQDPPIRVLARLPSSMGACSDSQDVVALRQGRHLLTTFHPELTRDNRFHDYFVRECVLGSA